MEKSYLGVRSLAANTANPSRLATSFSGYQEIIKLLLDEGADIHAQGGNTVTLSRLPRWKAIKSLSNSSKDGALSHRL
jgi:hypothetical protein